MRRVSAVISTDRVNRAVAGVAGVSFITLGLLGLADRGPNTGQLVSLADVIVGAVLTAGAATGALAARAANVLTGGGCLSVSMAVAMLDTARWSETTRYLAVGAVLVGVGLVGVRATATGR